MYLKNIEVEVLGYVLQNAKHRANDASNDVNRPPLLTGPIAVHCRLISCLLDKLPLLLMLLMILLAVQWGVLVQ